MSPRKLPNNINLLLWNEFRDGAESISPDSREESDEFLELCKVQGIRWITGIVATDHKEYWENYGPSTLYECNGGKLFYCNATTKNHLISYKKLMRGETMESKTVFDKIKEVNKSMSEKVTMLTAMGQANMLFQGYLIAWNNLPKYVYTVEYFDAFQIFTQNLFDLKIPNSIEYFVTMLLHHETSGTPYFEFNGRNK